MNAPVRIEVPPAEASGTAVRYRLRVADYLLLHEQGSLKNLETELVDGWVFVLSPEWRPHMRIKSELAFLLRRAVDAAGLRYFIGIEGSIALSDSDMPRPDILLTSDIMGDGPVPKATVPLLVEVSSTTLDDDLGLKAARYAAAGIPEYWVVDVRARVIHQMWSPGADGYSTYQNITFGEPLTSATIERLSISTSDF